MLKDIDKRDKPQFGANRPKSVYLGRPLRTRRLRLILWGGVFALLAFLALSWLHERLSAPASDARPSAEQLQIQRVPVLISEPTQDAASQRADAETADASTRAEGEPEETRPRTTRGEQATVVVTDLEPTQTRAEQPVEPVEVAVSEQVQVPAQTSMPVVTPADTTVTASDDPGEMSIQRSGNGVGSADRLFQRGMDALSAGHNRNAVQRFREALLVNPDHIGSIEQLAAIQFSRGFAGEALQLLRDALERNPGASDLLLLKARIYERIDEPRAALDLLRGRQFRLPQDADLLILQGAAATELEEYTLAIASYRQLVSWRSDQGNWWLALGFSLERSGDPLNMQEAAEAYRRALQDRSLSESARTFALDRREALGY